MTRLSTFHRSRLPHVTPVGATFFITFRVHDALPLTLIRRLRKQYEQEVIKILDLVPEGHQRKGALAKVRYRYFAGYDRHLDCFDSSRCPFLDAKACELLAARIKLFDGELYELKAYCIMPNHVHLLLSLSVQTVDDEAYYLTEQQLQSSYRPLCEIMRLIKGGSARELNQYFGKRGTFWQKDSYDHYVRDAKSYNNIIDYILHNPEKARLVENWRDYPFTYYV